MMFKLAVLVILLPTLDAVEEEYYTQRDGYIIIGPGGSNPGCIDRERHTTRIGCAVLCNIEASCKSISYRKTDGCCVLNTQQLYDFDVNYEENPLWDYYGPVENKVISYDWTLVFKAVSGTGGTTIWNAWSQPGVSHDLDLTNQNPAYFSKYAANKTYPFYRSHWLDDWSALGVKEVKVGLYENGNEVAYLIFGGTGSTRDDWFSHPRLLYSSWPDLSSLTTQIFSLEGIMFRKFYITQTSGLTNCDNFGWLIVLNRQANVCEFDKEAPSPQFLYSKVNSGTNFKNKEYGLAQVLGVFVRL